MSTSTPERSLIVPVRGEEGNVGPLIDRLHVAFSGNKGHTEVLFIDDSDNRKTGDAIQAAVNGLHTKYGPRSQVLLVRHIHRGTHGAPERKGGLAGAVVHGLEVAKSDNVLVMDGDLQHPPETAPELIAKIEAGHDIVVASRYRKGGSNEGLDGFFRKFVSRMATILVQILFLGGLGTDPMTGFFALRRDQIDMHVLRESRGYKILLEILARHPRLKRTEIPLQFQQRVGGESKAGEGNGMEFIRQLPRLRMATLPTIVNFMLGGGLIAVFGAVLLWMLVHSGVNPLAANSAQMIVTLALNFLYNRHLTWRGKSNAGLLRQMSLFALTRGASLVLGWFAFAGLMAEGARHHWLTLEPRSVTAYVITTGAVMVLNYITSKWLVFSTKGKAKRPRRKSRTPMFILALASIAGGGALIVSGTIGFGTALVFIILLYSGFSLVTSALEVRWRLYGRRTPEAQADMNYPEPVRPEVAQLSFSLIVPALDEPMVIGATLRRLLAQTHPYVQLVVTLVEGDLPTITAVQTVMRLHDPEHRITLVVKDYGDDGSKPAQLNAALAYCRGKYVSVFDAETLVAPELLVHVEAKLLETKADVLQSGVQLMNLDLQRPKSWGRLQRFPKLNRMLTPFFISKFWTAVRAWFCVHNVLEYFFWFSSRMFYQVDRGFVPLGGNTVFVKRSVLEAAGGWPLNLTEDCALGVVLSVQHGVKVVAVYDAELVSQEETPSHVFGRGGLVRQRTRWDQGFLSVLLQGEWLKLPTLNERVMAWYILAMPLIQALNGMFVPLAVVSFFALTAPVGVVMSMFLPFIPMLLSILTQVIGLREFGRSHGKKIRIRHYASLVILNPLYQLVLSWAAVRSAWKSLRGHTTWELTSHDGNHMTDDESASAQLVRM